MSFLKNYGAMLRREMAPPTWIHRQRDPGFSDDENSVKSQKYDARVTTTELKSAESPSEAHEIEPEDTGSKPAGRSILWPVIAAGAGLFSDGYINGNASTINSMLSKLYPKSYEQSQVMSDFTALTFLGTVVGMLLFGFISDYWSRKAGMLISTAILIIFPILGAGSWGIGMPEDPTGMFNMLVTMRVFMGLGIGGEYPAGSVACAEVSQRLPSGTRNRWFILFTDFMIDCAFVVVSTVAWVLLYICGVPDYPTEGNVHGLQAAWRVLLGLGAIPPLSLLYLRFKFDESEQFKQNNLKKAKKTPWWIIIKRYAPRGLLVGVIWFIYDFMTYSFGNYSSIILGSVVPTKMIDGEEVSNFKSNLGWNIVFNLFYIPGSFLGAFSSDYIGPRLTLTTGFALQGMVGFIMGAQYNTLTKNIAGTTVAYGIFQTLGEFGPGDNSGLISSKTCASAVRGRYYGIVAAIAKVGGLAGGYAFPAIANHFEGGLEGIEGQRVIVYVSSGLCFLAAILSLFIPEVSQEAIAMEDIKFRHILLENGYDLHDLNPEISEAEIKATELTARVSVQ